MELSALYDYFLECGGITTDSRNCPENSMFIALKGENFNGNAFAEEALRKGNGRLMLWIKRGGACQVLRILRNYCRDVAEQKF